MDEGLERISQEIGEPAPVGRPLGSFALDPQEMRKSVKEWFQSFEAGGDREGKVPTITDLAFHLGVTRATLWNYQKKDQFSPIIERAKTFCEMHAAQALFDPHIRPAGAIFTLKVNHGWKDGTENKGINFNFSWNAVQIEARKQLEEPDHTIDRSSEV